MFQRCAYHSRHSRISARRRFGGAMIRKLRTQRDNQQWMLDLALNMRGRVQNFERDDAEVPQGKRARNYRMLPKVWREAGGRREALARRAQALGFDEVATYHYDHAIESY